MPFSCCFFCFGPCLMPVLVLLASLRKCLTIHSSRESSTTTCTSSCSFSLRSFGWSYNCHPHHVQYGHASTLLYACTCPCSISAAQAGAQLQVCAVFPIRFASAIAFFEIVNPLGAVVLVNTKGVLRLHPREQLLLRRRRVYLPCEASQMMRHELLRGRAFARFTNVHV